MDIIKSRLISALIITIILIPLSIPHIIHSVENTTTDQSSIGPRLLSMMETFSGNHERVPIFIQFADGTKSVEMKAALESAEIYGLEIRHVFSIIPVISAYIPFYQVESVTGIHRVNRIEFDPKVSLESIDRFHTAQSSSGLVYTHPDKILSADHLWDEGYDGSGVTIAILDSGAQGDHPDLQDRLIGFKDFVNGEDDMDPSDGIDAYDDNGHGTACAWLAAGTGQEMGGVFRGMAPGASLLIVKVLDSPGTADDSTIAQGIEFAVEQGVDIISLSVGGTWMDSTFLDPSAMAASAAVEDGVTVSIAAGNDGPAAGTINSPGIAELAISVGASDGAIGVAPFSSRGPVERTITAPLGLATKPDLLAPGYQVVSGKWHGANFFEYPPYNSTQFGNAYTRWSGTSASAPQIAGLAALLMDKHSALTPLEIKSFLMAGATDIGQDPMAQGTGIANVSKASELIQDMSRVITKIVPIRYPTLPEGKSAFIVGESRDPQSVTVISTVNRGSVDIIISGNASDYVLASVNQTTVSTGYNYFEIGLHIPENLPLTAVGRYLGMLELQAGSITLSQLELDFTITTFGGRVLVDMAHHSPDDIDDPSYYKYFTDYLRDQGITLSEFGGTPPQPVIDRQSLSTADVFMIMDTETPYSTTEIQAIHEFVEDGGTLLILSEFYDTIQQTASFAFDSYNRILEPYGIQCERYEIGRGPDGRGLFYGTSYGGVVEEHPLTEGVENLYIVFGSTFSVDPSVAQAQGLFWIDSAKEHAVVAVASSGAGKVIAISDGSIVYDSIIFDAIRGSADNLVFLRNVAEALAPKAPRIYDVVLERGDIGELANVTSYIFGDDLESVSIIITGPEGTDITGDVVEELGYKFSAQFLLESGGFYDVTIIAIDAEGNVRMYERTILVTASPLEEGFFMTVIGIFLVVLGVGLAYVGILRFGKRKPRRRKDDYEWEIPVEDDSRPPEIQ